MDLGRDPVGERQAAAEEPTVADLAARYLQFHASKTKGHERTKRSLEAYVLPALGKKKVKDVTRADAERLAYKITQDGKPVAANRVLALLSALMNYAESAGMRPEGTNPCRRLKRNPERSRERFLTTAELERLGAALAAADSGDDHAAFHRTEGKEHPSAIATIRLLLLTGCRKNEILTLRWEHVDLDRSCLRLPDSKTGAKVVMVSRTPTWSAVEVGPPKRSSTNCTGRSAARASQTVLRRVQGGGGCRQSARAWRTARRCQSSRATGGIDRSTATSPSWCASSPSACPPPGFGCSATARSFRRGPARRRAPAARRRGYALSQKNASNLIQRYVVYVATPGALTLNLAASAFGTTYRVFRYDRRPTTPRRWPAHRSQPSGPDHRRSPQRCFPRTTRCSFLEP